ncbi:phytanoyl-CoA dioxygenase family protein [Dactylosporangium sp. NPDC005555]|uniref:phytanoyl-CoA dioxygenase family protein n=1 Tax=Dactylosporangium sp. NPDC005555 TaxID=3154889 RepID=UPI0033AAAC19
MWTDRQLAEFARDGYAVLRDVVPAALRDRAVARIDALLTERPPADGHTGHHFYWLETADEPELAALLVGSAAMAWAEALTAPREIGAPPVLQVALTFPPFPHVPGRGHLDGLPPTEPDGRPGTFTMLIGVVLSDQSREQMGNLMVWPGTHRACAELFRREGVQALTANGAYPDIPHGSPTPVLASPGDVILSSYLLSHNIGGNTSPMIRKTVYFRLKVDGHDDTWRDYVQDELYEFDGARRSVR